jgi:hypothetical protein
MKRLFLLFAAAAVLHLQAWDVEHDEIAQLAGEFLPAEIKKNFSFSDFGILMSCCHFPDMTEWGNPRRWRTLEEMGEYVGEDDVAVFRKYGFKHAGALHSPLGRAISISLLAKSFKEKRFSAAAFYISELTHSISDESALNHPSLLHFIQYSKFEGVDYRIRKVEESAKNVFGFRSDGYVMHRARELLKDYCPKVPEGCRTFAGMRESFVALCVDHGAYAAEKEGLIAFAPVSDAGEALARLVAMQVKCLVDMAWSAWSMRESWELPLPGYEKEIDKTIEAKLRKTSPRGQSVFAGVFDDSKNPENPSKTIALVCEPYGVFSKTKLSYVGRMLGASVCRTLRDNGIAVKGIGFFDLENEIPSVRDVQGLWIHLGSSNMSGEQVAAIKKYVSGGGILYAVGGTDPFDVTGFKKHLRLRENGEVPVSSKWGVQNAGVWDKMSIVFDPALGLGEKTEALRRNPNIDGFCKPYARRSIDLADGIEPLVWLDNGKEKFCVAARKGNVFWLSEYLLMPFLFSDDTVLDWGEMRLDSTASKLVLKIAGTERQ